MDRFPALRNLEKRFRSLRIVGALFTFLGVTVLLIGVGLLVFVIWALAAASAVDEPMRLEPGVTWARGSIGLLWSLCLFLSGLQFARMGALVRLMIDLEENPRATAQLLDRFITRFEPQSVDFRS